MQVLRFSEAHEASVLKAERSVELAIEKLKEAIDAAMKDKDKSNREFIAAHEAPEVNFDGMTPEEIEKAKADINAINDALPKFPQDSWYFHVTLVSALKRILKGCIEDPLKESGEAVVGLGLEAIVPVFDNKVEIKTKSLSHLDPKIVKTRLETEGLGDKFMDVVSVTAKALTDLGPVGVAIATLAKVSDGEGNPYVQVSELSKADRKLIV